MTRDREADVEKPARVAVTVAEESAVKADAVAENVWLFVLAAMETDAGTASLVLLDARVTIAPKGAVALRVAVQVLTALGERTVGPQVTLESAGV